MKPIRTIILNQYIWKFIVRILIVTAVVFVYFTDRDFITDFQTQPVSQSLQNKNLWPLVVLWAVMMLMMTIHFIPPRVFTMALLKRKKEKLDLDRSFDRHKLLEYVQDQNVRAWKVMLVWVLFNGIIGMLYLFGVLQVADLFLGPRKNGNTAQLLKKAMEGARDAGAEVEFIDLYDRSLNYKGCMSCFACKVKGGRKGICSFKDDLQPILEKAMEADVLVCGSPVYTAYPSSNLRAFMERLIFPAVNYSDFRHPVINKPKVSATIYTMNCPNKMVYQANAYDITMDVNASQLGMFGPTELMLSYDTHQFNDYSRYDAAQIDAHHKAQVHERQFPEDLEKAYALGRRLCQRAMGSEC